LAAFLLHQTILDQSALALRCSFTTSERSTLHSLTPDKTTQTARIFIGGYNL